MSCPLDIYIDLFKCLHDGSVPYFKHKHMYDLKLCIHWRKPL